MVVYAVGQAVNDVPSEADPGTFTVSADVVPEHQRGPDNMSIHLRLGTGQMHTQDPLPGDDVMMGTSGNRCSVVCGCLTFIDEP